MLAAAAQAGGDDEEGWEDGGDLEDDEGDGEGEGTGTPRWLPRANGAPHDPSQPGVIGGNHYLVGGTAEMQARAQYPARACALTARVRFEDRATSKIYPSR